VSNKRLKLPSNSESFREQEHSPAAGRLGRRADAPQDESVRLADRREPPLLS
jgi:hypothetical protein